jgi:hypothetical protein
MLLLGFAGGVVYQYFSLYMLEPLIARFTGALPDVSLFRPLIGNWGFLLLSFAVAWTVAAFGEEFVYRGIIGNSIVACRRNTAVFTHFLASDQRRVLGNCSTVPESRDRREFERNSGLGFVLEDRSPREMAAGGPVGLRG